MVSDISGVGTCFCPPDGTCDTFPSRFDVCAGFRFVDRDNSLKASILQKDGGVNLGQHLQPVYPQILDADMSAFDCPGILIYGSFTNLCEIKFRNTIPK